MDEMEMYRDRIEQRVKDRRRLKNDRRFRSAQPKFFDLNLMIDLAILGVISFILYATAGGK